MALGDRTCWLGFRGAAWTAAYDSNGKPRQAAQVAELTALLPDLTGRTPGGSCA